MLVLWIAILGAILTTGVIVLNVVLRSAQRAAKHTHHWEDM